eukprot:gene18056-21506_t
MDDISLVKKTSKDVLDSLSTPSMVGAAGTVVEYVEAPVGAIHKFGHVLTGGACGNGPASALQEDSGSRKGKRPWEIPLGVSTSFLDWLENDFLPREHAKNGGIDFLDNYQAFFYIDIFVVNQWIPPWVEDRDIPVEQSFKHAVKTAERTLLVLDPWKDPKALQRSWCLFEIATTLRQSQGENPGELQVCLSREQEQDFQQTLQKEFKKIIEVINGIDAARATATVATDKEKIDASINGAGGIGFAALNEAVIRQLRGWLLNRGHEALEKLKGRECDPERVEDWRDLCTMLEGLGKLTKDCGDYDSALHHFEECLSIRQKHAGSAQGCQGRSPTKEEIVCIVKNHNDLGQVMRKQNRYAQAKQHYDDALAMCKKHDLKELRAKTCNLLGRILMDQGSYLEAERECEAALEVDCEILKGAQPEGSEDVMSMSVDAHEMGKCAGPAGRSKRIERLKLNVASDLNTRGMLKMKRGRFQDAREDFTRSVRIRESLQGQDGILVGDQLLELATVLEKCGRYEEAAQMHERAYLIRRKQYGGAPHPSLVESLARQAELLQGQGCLREALEKAQEACAMSTSCKSIAPSQAVQACKVKAQVHIQRGELELAEDACHEGLTKWGIQDGESEPTAGSKEWQRLISAGFETELGRIKRKKGQTAEAIAHHKAAIKIRKDVQ